MPVRTVLFLNTKSIYKKAALPNHLFPKIGMSITYQKTSDIKTKDKVYVLKDD